jgi:hypothetical protein
MRIVDKRKEQTVDFRCLSAGQVFYYPEEEWYGIRLADETDAGENAVDLADGGLATIGELDQVIEINAQLEILN